jgi:tetratricopeptide (TPR) repeat protein
MISKQLICIMNRQQRRANAKRGQQSVDPAVAGMLGLGFEHHKAGRLAEAEGCYRRVLAIQPDHADALQLVGAVAYQLGRYDIAAESIGRAIKQDRNNPSWHSNLGLALERQGKFEEALASYNSALKLKPDDAEALNNRGNVLRALYRMDQALASYDKALALNRNYADAFNGRGMVLRDMSRFEDALASYDGALALNPGLVGVHNNRGVVLTELERSDEALSSYDRALSLSPNLVATLTNRGHLLQELGRADEALADFDKALASDQSYVEAVNGRGRALQTLNRLDEAEKVLRHAILLKPDYAEAYCNLGTVLIDLGRSVEAAAEIRHAVELKPRSAAALCNLGKVLIDLGRYDEAEAMIRRALALKPDHAQAHFILGTALIGLGRPDEAEQASRRAIALKPDLAGAHFNLGVALMELGRLTEARESAEKAVALAPSEPSAFRQLGEVRTYVAGDPYLTALEALSEHEVSLGTGKQIELNFALAKAHADVGRIEDEFKRLLAGNKLKRSCIDYDETVVLGRMDLVQRVLTSEFMRASQGAGDPSAKPIFILGMPRSGTTLVEQILASHPQVFGAGELKLFERALADVGSTMHEASGYPEIALHMSGEHFRELGARYLAEIEQLAPAASHVTDKMPVNFMVAGLIHLALPNATIIHTVRNPVDTCISCFSRLFTEENFHTYDLAELGRYYRHYAALMAHWQRVLPAGRILVVNYEDIVADVEGAARRVVAHCGLPWDQRCLDFHRTERVVRTSSAAQVRKPIYASSIGRGQAYQPFLGPLMAELMSL